MRYAFELKRFFFFFTAVGILFINDLFTKVKMYFIKAECLINIV